MQKNPKSTHLFIDGSNLYAGQYELFGPQRYLDFSKFLQEIEKEIKINKDFVEEN